LEINAAESVVIDSFTSRHTRHEFGDTLLNRRASWNPKVTSFASKFLHLVFFTEI